MGRVCVAFLVVALAGCAASPRADRLPEVGQFRDALAGVARSSCAPDGRTTQWMQRAIGGWEFVSRDALRLPQAPAPWMVFYDAACVWHVGFDVSRLAPGTVPVPLALEWHGQPLLVRATAHGGTVRLPDDSALPAGENVARTSLYGAAAGAFFVIATPGAWRRDAAMATDPTVEEFFLGVTIHELAHTRQLPLMIERLKAVASRHGLKNLSLDDDVVQNAFGGHADFRTRFEAERDVFYEAAAEPSRAARHRLIRKGLAMAEARRATHFTGENGYYRDFEDAFLSLEGTGQWAAYMFAQRSRSAGDALAFVRDNRRYWSQEEGLALFLLLDLEVPGWQRTVFSADDPGPFALLERALGAP